MTSENTDFKGRVALVTGGNAGIGLASALAFARRGASVVISGRRASEGEDAVRRLRDAGTPAEFVQSDVADEAQIKSLVARAVKSFGRLDFAFNNAGVEGVLGPVVEQTEENVQRVFDINVKGVLLGMKHQIAQMLRNPRLDGRPVGGAIVNNASVAGVVAMPGMSVYAASKHAVLGMTKAAALEVARQGIRVNAVSPAAIQTDMYDRFAGDQQRRAQIAEMHPIGRVGTADEIAQAVVWLCSDAAGFVTGHNLIADGGFTAQ